MSAVPAADDGRATGTVLVVEDDPSVREVVQIMLQRGGHRTIEAADGHEAVETVGQRREEIDVILLDVMMPRMTGHEAFPAIRAIAPDMPVVFFSGYDREEVAAHLGGTAHTAFLPKPFDKEGLLGAIEAALAAARG